MNHCLCPRLVTGVKARNGRYNKIRKEKKTIFLKFQEQFVENIRLNDLIVKSITVKSSTDKCGQSWRN